MWIEDVLKALWMKSGEERTSKLIQRIENNVIYYTNGTKESISSLVEQYNNFYKR